MSWIRAHATYVEAGAPERRTVRSQMDRADSVTATLLYERYLEEVFRYVLRRVPRIEEAEDITAEVFAAAFEGLPRFRRDCSPYLWLLGIARRSAIGDPGVGDG
jgi:RNA polymerase sigma-70 factor, ECF subfamily